MGRETGIREVMGSVTNVFLCGWMGALGSYLMSKAPPIINPKGMLGEALINMESLEAFTGLTQHVIDQEGDGLSKLSAYQLRDKVTREMFTHLEDEFEHQTPKALEQAIDIWKRHKHTERAEHINEFSRLLKPSKEVHQGTYALEEILLHQPAESVKKNRFQLGRASLKAENNTLKQLIETLEDGGYTEKIHYKGPGLFDETPIHLKSREMKNLMRDFKHYLEHVFDRSIGDLMRDELGQDLKASADFNKPLGEVFNLHRGIGLGSLIKEKLIGKTQPWYSPKRYLPQLQDGLFHYIEKQKIFTTAAMLLAATSVSVGVTFVNAWITKRKFGGANIYPGDELAAQKLKHSKPGKASNNSDIDKPEKALNKATQVAAQPAVRSLSQIPGHSTSLYRLQSSQSPALSNAFALTTANYSTAAPPTINPQAKALAQLRPVHQGGLS